MKIYAASKAKHGPWWAALGAAGLNISSTWPEWRFNYNGELATAEDWASHWKSCIDQAATLRCSSAARHGRRKGALIELGAALAAGRKVFVVSPFPWTWNHHPNVTVFNSLAEAIAAIRASEG
jgi:hypothetical protein